MVSKHAFCVKECFLSGHPKSFFNSDVEEGRRSFQVVLVLSMGVTRLLTGCFVDRVEIFEVLPFPAWEFTGLGDFDLMWASR